MVTIYGNSISSGFTSGTPLVAIYTYGCQVWPVEESWTGPWPGPEVHPGDYYISWTPTDISGVFSIEGRLYYLESYSGYFDDFSGTITSSAFISNADILTVETTARKLDYRAFAGCSHLKTANLPHCSVIGTSAFHYCLNLSSVSMPECTHVMDSAFMRCYNLREIILPEVTYIGSGAFANCWGGRYLFIGSNCNQIGSDAFYSFGYSNYNSGYRVTYKAGWEGEGVVFAGLGYFTHLICPGWKYPEYRELGWSGTSISGYCHIRYPGFESYYNYTTCLTSGMYSSAGSPSWFETDAVYVSSMNSTELVSASMSQLYRIEHFGFANCSNLEELYVPKLEIIYSSAFQSCKKLKYLYLPICSSIDSYAFNSCTSLSYIMLGSNYCEISEGTFSGCTNLTAIYVKSNRVSYYKSSNYWSDYSDIIYPIPN